MGELINLRTARKRKQRTDRARKADANRAAFGRTKAEKTAADSERDRTGRTLDGKRIDAAPGAPDTE